VTIVTHPRSKTGVPWCQSRITSETTPNSNHQRLKLARRATPATLLASPRLHPPPPSFLVVDILSEEFERADRRGHFSLFFGRSTHNLMADRPPIHKGPFMTQTRHSCIAANYPAFRSLSVAIGESMLMGPAATVVTALSPRCELRNSDRASTPSRSIGTTAR
jgi:hypothetical protein